jgi:hypothetical protein
MRSPVTEATSSAASEPVTVRVQLNDGGSWEVELPAHHAQVTCETLDEIRRVAYLWAAHTRPCELIMRDPYQRVLRRESIEGISTERPY